MVESEQHSFLHPLSGCSQLSSLDLIRWGGESGEVASFLDLNDLPPSVVNLSLRDFTVDQHCFEDLNCLDLKNLTLYWMKNSGEQLCGLLRHLSKLQVSFYTDLAASTFHDNINHE